MRSSEGSSKTGVPLVAVLCTVQFLGVFDSSMVAVSTPSIARSLQIAQGDLSWINNAFLPSFAGMLLLGGRIADLVGAQRALVAGQLGVAITTLACGLAHSDSQFYAARAFQGAAAALTVPAALSLILANFAPGAARVRALGGWGAMAGAGGVMGTLVGGALTSGPGWEWIFLARSPMAAALAVTVLVVIDADRAVDNRRLDLAGAVTATASVTLLVLAVVEAPRMGWGSAFTLGLLGAVALLAALFVLAESQATSPLVPAALVRVRSVSGANAGRRRSRALGARCMLV